MGWWGSLRLVRTGESADARSRANLSAAQGPCSGMRFDWIASNRLMWCRNKSAFARRCCQVQGRQAVGQSGRADASAQRLAGIAHRPRVRRSPPEVGEGRVRSGSRITRRLTNAIPLATPAAALADSRAFHVDGDGSSSPCPMSLFVGCGSSRAARQLTMAPAWFRLTSGCVCADHLGARLYWPYGRSASIASFGGGPMNLRSATMVSPHPEVPLSRDPAQPELMIDCDHRFRVDHSSSSRVELVVLP